MLYLLTSFLVDYVSKKFSMIVVTNDATDEDAG